ncbi:MAG TPA: Rpn family recombination-promoting nuclease/putative transposase [Thermoanaerobaculia bacterium]|nr:Rpn family recombination-promoting nuclease/putative transposase [Thermoanaerobaculia bacterium]
MKKHDQKYRFLFAHPDVVASLISDFVPEPWVESLDLSTLERVNATYVSDTLDRREGDMVWKLRRRDGSPVFVYFLIEFQARADRFMAVRLMGYMAALYQDLIARKELAPGRRLPLVVPLVVYNGARRWRAPLELSALLEPVDPAAEIHIPQLRYRVIDEGTYNPEELPRQGAVGKAFWMKTLSAEDLHQALPGLRRDLNLDENPSLFRAFLVWLGEDPDHIPENLDREEIPEMWDSRAHRWQQELRQEGEAKVILRLLERKFGPLDTQTRTRVQSADADRLLNWADRILFAERLEQVFVE